MADSHFISKHIGRRQLAAYYLGCPMTHHFLSAFETHSNTLQSSELAEKVQRIKKVSIVGAATF